MGDCVYWYDSDTRFEGTLTKMNRRSVKAVQTNEAHRYTRAAFNSHGGRKKGAKGREWTLGVGRQGETVFSHTAEQEKSMEDTSRGAMMRRAEKNSALGDVAVYVKRAFRLGVSLNELQTIVNTASDEDFAMRKGE